MTAPTSDERRKVAERLRKDVGESSCIDYAVFRIAHEVMGIEDVTGAKAAHMLADLIDRPTCHICETDHEFEDSVRCDRCRMTFKRPWEPFKYCPECGARVVSDDDASRD